MPKLIMTTGLPGSGKSTWADAVLRESTPGSVVRINKDLLRKMLHADVHAKGTEKQILAARDAMCRMFLRQGVDVIVDDTNLAAFHEEALRKIALQCQADFEVKDFRDVDIELCIQRDLQRTATVGEKVIQEMKAKYL
jgi:predicted kinase